MLRLISPYPVSNCGCDDIISHTDMTKLRPGDKVDVRIKSGAIVSPYKNYDEIKTFEIVAVAADNAGYYLYVPQYCILKETLIADKYVSKRLHIDKRFLDETIVHIDESMIAHVHARLDGMKCSKCGEFCQFAGPNQPNHTLICWSCRQYRYR
jgi:hypothetical protein